MGPRRHAVLAALALSLLIATAGAAPPKATFAEVRALDSPPEKWGAWSTATHPGFEVFLPTGAVYHDRTLFTLPGNGHAVPFVLSHVPDVDYDGPWGRNWRSSFDARLEVPADGSLVLVDARGARHTFTPRVAGGWDAPPGVWLLAQQEMKGKKVRGYRFTGPDRWSRFFDTKGRFTEWRRPDGGVLKLKRANDHRLLSLVTPEKRALSLKYGKDLRAASLKDFAARVHALRYDDAGNLTHIVRPLRKGDLAPVSHAYAYDLLHRLISVGNGRGSPLGTVEYDAAGRAAAIRHASGDTLFGQTGSTVRVTGRGGSPVEDLAYDAAGRSLRRDYVVVGNVVESETFTYDAVGRRVRWARPGGDSYEWTYVDTTDPRDGCPPATFTHRAADDPATPPLVRAYTYRPGTQQVLADTAPGGAVTDCTYDANGNLLTMRLPAYRTKTGVVRPVETYAYDKFNRLLKTVHADGTEDAYVFGKGNVPRDLVAEQILDSATGNDPDTGAPRVRESTRFTYDKAGNVTKLDRAKGTRVQSFAYDAWDRAVSVADGKLASANFTYDADGNLVLTSRPFKDDKGVAVGTGSVDIATTYDGFGLSMTETGRDGVRDHATNRSHDIDHLEVTQTTDPLGSVTDVVLDHRGRTVSRTEAKGTPAERTYDTTYGAFDGPTEEGWAGLEKMKYEYDGLGRVVRQIRGDGVTTHLAYDASGRLASQTVRTGTTDQSRTRFTYDAAGNLMTTEHDRFTPGQAGNVIETSSKWYDLRGGLVEEMNPCGCVTRYVRDGTGRVVRATEVEMDVVTNYLYDAVGNLREQEVVRGATTASPVRRKSTMTYDALGRLTRVVDPDGNATAHAYDSVGNVVRTTVPDGAVLDMVRDGAGRLISETSTAGGNSYTSTYTYDAAGRLVGEALADGRTITHVRDALGRVTSTTSGGTTVGSWTYDDAGRVASRTPGAGGTIAYGYDAGGRMSSATAPGGLQVYGFDSGDRLTAATDTVGGNVVSVTQGYDSLGNQTVDRQNGVGVVRAFSEGGHVDLVQVDGGRSYAIERDCPGRVTTVTTGATDTTYEYLPGTDRVARRVQPRMTSEYEYDGATRRTRAKHTTAEAVNSDWTAQYGARGLLTSHEREDGSGETRAYDAHGRMVSSVDSGLGGTSPVTTTIAYAAAQDRPSSIVTSNDTVGKWELKSHLVNVGYDTQGRVASAGTSTYDYDASGYATNWFENRPAYTAGERTVTYDPFGRVATVRNGADEIATYRYDVLGRPIMAVEEEFTGATDLTRQRVFDGCRLVRELSPVGQPGFDLFYDPDWAGAGHAASGFADTFTSNYLWQDDCLGAPRQLYNATPATGRLQERYDRTDAWGQWHFEFTHPVNGVQSFRGAESLQSAANLPGYASSYASGFVFSWGGPQRDPFLPRPLDPNDPPPGGPNGPGGGPFGPPPFRPVPGGVGWIVNPLPDDGMSDLICSLVHGSLAEKLEQMRRAEHAAFVCNNQLQSVLTEISRLGFAIEDYNRRRDELNDSLAAQQFNLGALKTLDKALDAVGLAAGALKTAGKLVSKGLQVLGNTRIAAGASSRVTRGIAESNASKAAAGLVGDTTEFVSKEAGSDAGEAGGSDAGVVEGMSLAGQIGVTAAQLITGHTIEGDAAEMRQQVYAAEVAAQLSRSEIKRELEKLEFLNEFKDYLREGVNQLCLEVAGLAYGAGAWADSDYEKDLDEFNALKEAIESRIGL